MTGSPSLALVEAWRTYQKGHVEGQHQVWQPHRRSHPWPCDQDVLRSFCSKEDARPQRSDGRGS